LEEKKPYKGNIALKEAIGDWESKKSAVPGRKKGP